MTEGGNGSSDGGQVVEQLPTLGVGHDRLSFIVGNQVAHIKLEDLVRDAVAPEGPGRGPVPLLLFGLVLTMANVDRSLRKIVEISEGQVAQRTTITGSDPAALIETVAKALRSMGMKIPDGGPKT